MQNIQSNIQGLAATEFQKIKITNHREFCIV